MPSVKLIAYLFSKLWQRFKQRTILSMSNQTALPILSAAEIVEYAEALARTAGKIPPNFKQSDALRQGEQSSRFMGAGLEYEESRAYQMGDEIRRINWRLMARTGKAYTKLFQEERQENWFILVDHRSSMRFGTRKRLKATQAARVAGYYAWQAQQAGIPVSTGRLAEDFVFSPIYEGKLTYANIMQAICKPCPPMTNQNKNEPELNDVFLSLTARLQPGARLIVISDFHDVNQRTAEILTALQDSVKIKTIFINDISEVALPDIEGLQLQSMVDNQVYEITSEQQRESYQAWSAHYQQAIQSLLRQANVALYSLYAHDSLLQLSQALSTENIHFVSAEVQPDSVLEKSMKHG